jgi:hypothetical protein
MSNEPFIRTEFELTAKFKHRKGGETEFKDIVAMSATFALNAIPTCTLDVATGIEVRTEKRATIHDMIDKLQPRDRCTVFLTIKSTEGRMDAPIINGMKDGKYIVFDGYYAGIGYQRAHNNCSYTIHLVHWLDDLNCSSMLNGDWSQNVPHDLAQVASSLVIADLTGGDGGGAGRSPSGARAVPMIDNKAPDSPDGGVIVTQANMEKDLWEEVIKKIFRGITNMPHPAVQCQQPPPDNGTDTGPSSDGLSADELGKPGYNNRAAWKALERIPGKAPAKYKAKLPLNLSGFEGGDPFLYLSLSAHEGLCRMILDGMGYNSIWSKLIGDLAPSFLFAISPSVEYAQAVPFFPGLSTPHVTIHGDEYNYANFNANCANMISSIVIYWSPQGDSSGAVVGGKLTPEHGFCYPAGQYPKKEGDYNDHWGNILVRDPPAWLASPVYTQMYPRENHINTEGRSPLDPQKGSEKNPEAPQSHSKVEAHYRETVDFVDGEYLNVYDRFACHWYKSATLGQRYGELSGKLRFDIAPGSIIKILPPVERIGNTEGPPMYGAVVQVSFAINAEQHTAGTSFALSHLRTEKENDVNDPTSKKHYVGEYAPIYKYELPGSPWKGGPLVPMAGDLGAADAPTDAGAPAFNPGNFGGIA